MVDMDYLNIDMNICQLLLLRYNDQNLQASGSFQKTIRREKVKIMGKITSL